MGCWISDSWEAVGEPYWKLRLASGVCTGGLHMAAVKEQGDMMAPCCWSGVCGLVEDEFRLPWDTLGAGYIACAAAAAAAAAGSMRAAEALAMAEAL